MDGGRDLGERRAGVGLVGPSKSFRNGSAPV